MTSLQVLWIGKIPMIVHGKQGDVPVALLDVADVPGVPFSLFSLAAVMPKCAVSLYAEGVHMLNGGLSFLRGEARSFVEATRVVETPIVAAVLAPRKMRLIDLNDVHVSLAHSHADILRETARQMEIKVFGELVPCARCSEVNGRRTAVPRTSECRSTGPLGRLFVHLSGQHPKSAGRAEYLMMIDDDYLRMGWPMASAGFWPTLKPGVPRASSSAFARTPARNKVN